PLRRRGALLPQSRRDEPRVTGTGDHDRADRREETDDRGGRGADEREDDLRAHKLGLGPTEPALHESRRDEHGPHPVRKLGASRASRFPTGDRGRLARTAASTAVAARAAPTAISVAPRLSPGGSRSRRPLRAPPPRE